MDAPPVQYVKTSDGYDIAYSVRGTGRPVVFLPTGVTHLQLVGQHDFRLAEWLRLMAGRYQLIQYDSRGQGMSTRQLNPDHSIRDLETDLDAVLRQLQAEQVVLVGYFYSAHVAIRYAMDHAERVKALVLISCSVSMDAWPLESMVGIAERNWDGFLHGWVPGDFTPEQRRELVDYFKQARNRDDWLISARAFSVSDVSRDLQQLRMPTLVLHPRDFLWLPPEESMKVAANIEGARFQLLDGLLPLGEPHACVSAIDSFLAGLAAVTEGAPPTVPTPVALSGRQREVLQLVAAGKTNREVADDLVLSVRTVERHLAEAYAKMGVHNRFEAIAMCRELLTDGRPE
jgi:pimeloyl-ACP methyl ester carboxylesterase/DNA-binding CsgD family transcriptional regulator